MLLDWNSMENRVCFIKERFLRDLSGLWFPPPSLLFLSF